MPWAKAAYYIKLTLNRQKHGEQSGLETPVVHALTDGS